MRIPAVAVLGAAVISGTPAFAQGISAGIKGGANFTTVKFEGEPDATSGRWSGAGGAFVVVPLRWRVSLQPEVVYAMKGARLRGAGTQPSLLLDYVEVPILARVNANVGGRRVFAVGGAAPAFAVRARTRTKFGGSTEEIDIVDEIHRFDAGIVGGGGVEFGSVVVDGRYTFGLTDIDKDGSDIAHARNRALSVAVGWRFR